MFACCKAYQEGPEGCLRGTGPPRTWMVITVYVNTRFHEMGKDVYELLEPRYYRIKYYNWCPNTLIL